MFRSGRETRGGSRSRCAGTGWACAETAWGWAAAATTEVTWAGAAAEWAWEAVSEPCGVTLAHWALEGSQGLTRRNARTNNSGLTCGLLAVHCQGKLLQCAPKRSSACASCRDVCCRCRVTISIPILISKLDVHRKIKIAFVLQE